MLSLLEKEEYRFLKDFDIMYLALSGSYATHLETETSDYDMKGILFPSKKDLSLCRFEDKVYTYEDLDLTLYSYGAFLRLLNSMSPAIVDMLYTDRVLIRTSASDLFYRNGALFETPQLLYSNLAFVDKQLTRLGNMLNKNEDARRFNLFKMLDRVYTKDLFYVYIKVLEVDNCVVDNTYIIPKKYIDQAKEQGINYMLDTEVKLHPLKGALQNETSLKLGDAVIGLLKDTHLPIGEMSKLIVDINQVYKSYLKSSGTFLIERERTGKMGKHLLHIYRVLFTLEDYMKTGYFNLDMTYYRDYLLAIKQLATIEDAAQFFSDDNILEHWRERVDLTKRWVDKYVKEVMARQTKEERSFLIDGLTMEVMNKRWSV